MFTLSILVHYHDNPFDPRVWHVCINIHSMCKWIDAIISLHEKRMKVAMRDHLKI